jgi:sec-independent protein translocase protein TatB
MPGFEDSAFIVLLALLLFGPKKLPVLARQFGKLMADFRRASSEFRTQMEDELRVSEQADRQKHTAAIEASTPTAPILDSAQALAAEAAYANQDLPSLDSTPDSTPEPVPPLLPDSTSESPIDSSFDSAPDSAPDSISESTPGTDLESTTQSTPALIPIPVPLPEAIPASPATQAAAPHQQDERETEALHG